MKVVKFGIWVVTFVMLSSCSSLSGWLSGATSESCYSVDTLNAKQRAALDVGNGNPILIAGGERIVCTCYRSSSLAGDDESDRLAGDDESGKLASDDETGLLASDDESGNLASNDETGLLASDDERALLNSDFAKLSCRLVQGCSGFQLIGYKPKQIIVLTATGQKSVSASCITW